MALCVHRLTLGVLAHQDWKQWFHRDSSAGRTGDRVVALFNRHLQVLRATPDT